MLAAGAFAIFALGFAGMKAWQSIQDYSSTPPAIEGTGFRDPSKVPSQVKDDPLKDLEPKVARPHDVPAPRESKPSLPAEDSTPTLSFSANNLPLHKALQDFALKAGITLTIAPKTPNPPVNVHFENAKTTDILSAMGVQYNFVVFSESDGHFLIIPREPEADAPEGNQGHGPE